MKLIKELKDMANLRKLDVMTMTTRRSNHQGELAYILWRACVSVVRGLPCPSRRSRCSRPWSRCPRDPARRARRATREHDRHTNTTQSPQTECGSQYS